MDLVDVEIPAKYDYFILTDHCYSNQLILIFCSDQNRKVISNGQVILFNETFENYPKSYYMIYR